MKLKKIIAGGQTGVDRAALDVALAINIAHGGWCPKGRCAEDGVIPARYHLWETSSNDYSERTRLNIETADGTLILVPSLPLSVTDGTQLTIQLVQQKNKPHLIVDLSSSYNVAEVLTWLSDNDIEILNIAGPRESQSVGIYHLSRCMLGKLFTHLNDSTT